MDNTMVPSPDDMRRAARWAGLLFLATMVAGVLAETLTGNALVVAGNADATVANIGAHADRYRLGFTLYMVEMLCQVGMTVCFYRLLRPVSVAGASLAAAFGLVGIVIKTVARTFYLTPLLVVGGQSRLLDAASATDLTMLALRLNEQTAGIALVFFGVDTLIRGGLFVRSRMVPPMLGSACVLAGAGWLTFLWPPLGLRLFPVVALVALVAGVALAGWLVAVGPRRAG